jgi:dephospho-CoA kinase
MIIGITGTIGAGKGALVDHLVATHGFKHYAARDFLAEEVMKRGLPLERDSFRDVGNDLRAKHGPGYVISELYKKAEAAGGHAIVESVRTVGEIEAAKALGDFRLFAVDADLRMRYDRITNRGTALDHVSFEEFVEDERMEMESTDPNKQNIKACVALADRVFLNEGTLEDFHAKVDEAVRDIL